MAEKIRLVRNDTRPQLIVNLTDTSTGNPIDVSSATTRLKFRAVGDETNRVVLVATAIPGLEDIDGDVNSAAPYDVAGRGGRCVFNWTSDALTGDAGDYEGEIEITFNDGTIQTVYELLKFKLREDFSNA